MVGTLSQELIDLIIDHLGDTYLADSQADRVDWRRAPLHELWRNSLADLRSASLVCNNFRPRAQLHIFSVIRLFLCVPGLHAQDETSTRHRERMQGLLNVLQTRHHFAGARIYLSISHELSNPATFDPTEDVAMMNLVRYIRTSAMQVTALGLTAMAQGAFAAQDLQKKFIDHFADTSYITRLELRSLGSVSKSLFSHYPRLTDFVMSFVKFEGWAGAATPHIKAPQLRKLVIENNSESLGVLLGIDTGHHPLLNVTKLESLTIRPLCSLEEWTQNKETPRNAHLAKLCGATLKNLYVDLRHDARGRAISSLYLRDFLNLHTFGFCVNWVRSSCKHLCGWIAQLPPSPVLCEVNLHIIISKSILETLHDDWELLDETLFDLFRSSQSTTKIVSIVFFTVHLTSRDLSMVLAEYLGMEKRDQDAVRENPTLRLAVQKRVSRYLFNVCIEPKFLKLLGSTDIGFKVTSGGELSF